MFGGRALRGELPAALVLLIWLAGAGFGLLLAARRLLQLILTGKALPRPMRHHPWREGMPSAGRVGDAEGAGGEQHAGTQPLFGEDRDPQP